MTCDMIVASETAQFGQPEINLGIIPGAGGTQRLTRAVGKALAMEMILTDRRLTAEEALRYGLVYRVSPVELYLTEAIELAQKVASKSQVAIRMAKEAVNKSQELPLAEGLTFEKRNFFLLFGTEDRSEGMNAFIEKRKAEWKHK
jgi:enoyl-CoA hydratase